MYNNLKSQSLFYWIIYSYNEEYILYDDNDVCLNPYFTGLSILITHDINKLVDVFSVSILILLDYLFL